MVTAALGNSESPYLPASLQEESSAFSWWVRSGSPRGGSCHRCKCLSNIVCVEPSLLHNENRSQHLDGWGHQRPSLGLVLQLPVLSPQPLLSHTDSWVPPSSHSHPPPWCPCPLGSTLQIILETELFLKASQRGVERTWGPGGLSCLPAHSSVPGTAEKGRQVLSGH